MTNSTIRWALIGLATMALAACQTAGPAYAPRNGPRPTVSNVEAPKPDYPSRAAPKDVVPSQPPASAPTIAPLASPRVESRELEALPPAAPPPARTRPDVQEPAYTPVPTRAAPAKPVVKFFVTGKLVDATGPARSYTVKKGDHLDSIARDLDTSRKQLADDNKLKEPYALKPGQTLKLPGGKAKAYVVGQGDTLFSIAQRFSVSAAALASANDMGKSKSIKSGQKLILPPGYKDKGAIRRVVTPEPEPQPAPPPRERPRPTPPAREPDRQPPAVQTERPTPPAATVPDRPQPYTPTSRPGASSATRAPVTLPPVSSPPVATPPVSRPYTPPPATSYNRPPPPQPSGRPAIVPSSPAPLDSEVSVAGKGRFVWPVRGDIISDFGPKGTGQRNDGLNIRATPGAVVRAAAAGEIVYAGDQVPGFGNLVLVKHADGWVTAYAHLSKISVQMRQQVPQGTEIGQAGMSGGVGEPQLHFEVRYAPTPQDRAKPIDPKLVLPR